MTLMCQEGGGERGIQSCLCTGQRVRDLKQRVWSILTVKICGKEGPSPAGSSAGECLPQQWPTEVKCPMEISALSFLPSLPCSPLGCELVPLGHAQVTSRAGVGGSAPLGRWSAHHKPHLAWETAELFASERSKWRGCQARAVEQGVQPSLRQMGVLWGVRRWKDVVAGGRGGDKQSRQAC